MRTYPQTYKLIFFIMILISSTHHSFSQSLTAEDEYILELRSKSGEILTDAIIVLKIKDRWLVPFNETVSSMGFFIQGSVDSGIYEGFIRSEENIYSINGEECQVKYRGMTEKHACEKFFKYDGSWYLDQNLFEKMFEVDLKHALSKSEIIVESNLPLPKEILSKLNEKQGKMPYEKRLKLETAPYEWIDGFNLYQRIQNGHNKQGETGETFNQFQHDLYFRSEMAKMSLKSNISSVDGAYRSDWLSLSRSDPREKDANPYAFNFFEVGNLRSYTTPYLLSSGKVTGVNFNNRDLDRVTNFLTQDFQGELRTGWFLEVYRNDVLIATAEPDANQRYLIQGVPLVLGHNRMHLIFYGPFGNTEHRYENFLVDSTMLSSKKIEYNVSAGQDGSGKTDLYLNLDTRIGNRNLLSAYFKQDDVARYQFDFRGMLFNSAYTLSHAESKDGNLNGITLNSNIKKISLFSRYTDFNGYQLFNQQVGKPLDKDLLVSMNTSIMSLLVGLDYIKQIDIDDLTINEIRNRIGYGKSNLYFGNVLSIRDRILNGEAFMRFSHNGGFTHRLSNFYMKDRPSQKVALQTAYESPKQRFRITLERNFEVKTDSLMVSSEKDFKKVLGFTSFTGNTRNDFSIVMGIGVLLDVDPQTDFADIRSQRNVEMGQVVARAFLDLNENGLMDADESPLKGIEFRNGQNRDVAKTDEKGNGRFENLLPWFRVRIEVVSAKIQSIYHQPVKPKREIYLRGGKTAHLDFPFVLRGEVYGEIEGTKNYNRYSVHLFQDQKLSTILKVDNEGYYIFEGLPLNKETQVKVYDLEKEKYISTKRVEFIDYQNPSVEMNFPVKERQLQ